MVFSFFLTFFSDVVRRGVKVPALGRRRRDYLGGSVRFSSPLAFLYLFFCGLRDMGGHNWMLSAYRTRKFRFPPPAPQMNLKPLPLTLGYPQFSPISPSPSGSVNEDTFCNLDSRRVIMKTTQAHAPPPSSVRSRVKPLLSSRSPITPKVIPRQASRISL